MKLHWSRVFTVPRREFITTVKRRAFLLTLIGTPAYFALVMTFSSGAAINEGRNALKEFKALGVVDSSGLFRDAETTFRTTLQPGRTKAGAQGNAAGPASRDDIPALVLP